MSDANAPNRQQLTPRGKNNPCRAKQKKQAPKKDGHILGVELPEYAAAMTQSFLLYGPQEGGAEAALGLLEGIQEQSLALAKGDLATAERILCTQITTLQAAFNRYLSLGAALAGKNPEASDRYIQLALRCQDQCRKSILALHELKNPRKSPQFIQNYVDKQLNQLKIDSASLTPPALEESTHAPMDFGSKGTSATTDSEVEAVGVEQWASDPWG